MFKSNVGWIFCQIWSHCRLEYNKSDQMLEFKVAQLFHKVAQFVATNVVFKDCNIAQKVAKHLNDFWKKICPPRPFKTQGFSKITQSGHSEHKTTESFLFWRQTFLKRMQVDNSYWLHPQWTDASSSGARDQYYKTFLLYLRAYMEATWIVI